MIQPLNNEENSLLLHSVCELSVVLFFHIKQLYNAEI
jgi:hypothetical protein